MEGSFSAKEIFLLGWPVLSLLLLCSVVSLAVILERFVHFSKRKVDVEHFFGKIGQALAAGGHRSLGEPMASVVKAATTHGSRSKDQLELVVDRAVRMQVADLENYVPFLGTIAAVAPFIGLLGTVMGIIRAFKSIALAGGSGGPQVVAAGIAEALIATALGLVVAIPALVAYNYFSVRIRRMAEDMEICSDELLEILVSKK